MSDCLIEYLPKDMIYYTAKKISRHGQTRFDIDTCLFNPLIKRYIHLKLPIESILLYYHKTPIANPDPQKLFNHTLKSVDFSALNVLDLSKNNYQKTHNGQLYFEFNYDSPILKKNMTILLPKLILIRVTSSSNLPFIMLYFFIINAN